MQSSSARKRNGSPGCTPPVLVLSPGCARMLLGPHGAIHAPAGNADNPEGKEKTNAVRTANLTKEKRNERYGIHPAESGRCRRHGLPLPARNRHRHAPLLECLREGYDVTGTQISNPPSPVSPSNEGPYRSKEGPSAASSPAADKPRFQMALHVSATADTWSWCRKTA